MPLLSHRISIYSLQRGLRPPGHVSDMFQQSSFHWQWVYLKHDWWLIIAPCFGELRQAYPFNIVCNRVVNSGSSIYTSMYYIQTYIYIYIYIHTVFSLGTFRSPAPRFQRIPAVRPWGSFGRALWGSLLYPGVHRWSCRRGAWFLFKDVLVHRNLKSWSQVKQTNSPSAYLA